MSQPQNTFWVDVTVKTLVVTMMVLLPTGIILAIYTGNELYLLLSVVAFVFFMAG
jgi:hypothetical protein